MTTSTKQNELETTMVGIPKPIDPTPAPATYAVVDTILDQTGPITGNVAQDGYTDELTPVISGHIEGGKSMEIQVWLNSESVGFIDADNDGNWSFTPAVPLEPNQEYYLQVSIADPGGSKALVMSLPSHFYTTELGCDDLSTPPAATNITVTDNVEGGIVGALANNDLTNDNHAVISGEGRIGQWVIIFDDGKEIGSATVGADGTWSFKPTDALSDGVHNITTQVENPTNGLLSDGSTAFTFTVDTHVDAPVITGLYDDVGKQTGLVEQGGLTDDNNLTAKGTAEPHATVNVYCIGVKGNTELAGVAVADDQGNWTLSPIKGIMGYHGNHTFFAVATDEAGNVSGHSDGWIVDYVGPNQDYVVPDMATDITVTDNVKGGIVGELHNHDVTNDSTPTISGKATAGDIVNIYDHGVAIGSVAVSADGTWSYTPAALDESEHSFTVSVASPKYNTDSDQSDAISITVDLHANAPVITGAYDSVGKQQGFIANGGNTDDQHPTFTGTSEADATVYIYMRGSQKEVHLLGSTVADDNGNWSFYDAAGMVSYYKTGTHPFWAVQVDEAGNKSANSNIYNLHIVGSDQDIVNPDAATDIQLHDNAGAVTGLIHTGDTTDDNAPVITGKATVGDVVIISDGDTVLGSVTVTDTSGAWSFTSPELTDGAHSISTVVENPATGADSQATDAVNFTVQTAATLDPAVIDSVLIHYQSDYADLHDGDVVASRTPYITGHCAANDIVAFYDNGTLIASVQADASGKWTFASPDLTDGEHKLTAVVLDSEGHHSDSVNVVDFTVGNELASVYDSLNSSTVVDNIYQGNGFTVTSDAHLEVLPVDQFYPNIAPICFENSTNSAISINFDSGVNTFHLAVATRHLVPGEGLASTEDTHMVVYDTQGNIITDEMKYISYGGDPLEYHAPEGVTIGSVEFHTNDYADSFYLYNLTYQKVISPDPLQADHLTVGTLDAQDQSALAQDATISMHTEHHQTTTINLDDVLAHGQENHFLRDGNLQIAVTGQAGDTVELNTSSVEWHSPGEITTGGVIYDVYRTESDSHAEILVQHGLEVH